MEPLVGILAALAAAAFIGELLSYANVPRVVGQVAAGLLLGIPAVRTLIFPEGTALIEALANVGVVVLLYFTGLEVNFKSFARNVGVATGISVGNTTLALAAGYAVSRYIFNLDPAVSFIVGVCASVSASALALDLLEEFRLLRSRFGAMVVSAAAVDDVYEIAIITVAVAFIEASAAQTALLGVLLNALVFLAVIVLFRILIIPFILRFIEKSTEVSLLMSGLIITLLLAVLSSWLGLGSLIGALTSGILVRQALIGDVRHHRPWESHSLSRAVHTVAFGFFVPLFFVQVGLLTDLSAIWTDVWLGLALSAIAIFGTVVGSAAGYAFSTGRWREGFLLGWSLTGKGDTELVIAALALKSGIISGAIFSSLIFMAVMCTLIAPLVFRHLLKHGHV